MYRLQRWQFRWGIDDVDILESDVYTCGWHLELDLVMMCIQGKYVWIFTSESNAAKFVVTGCQISGAASSMWWILKWATLMDFTLFLELFSGPSLLLQQRGEFWVLGFELIVGRWLESILIAISSIFRRWWSNWVICLWSRLYRRRQHPLWHHQCCTEWWPQWELTGTEVLELWKLDSPNP